jgi:hypothetical protein
MSDIGVPRRAQTSQEHVQGITASTVAAAATSVSAGKHNGTNDDTKPHGATDTVHELTDDNCASTDANDAATADDADDGADATYVRATVIGSTEHAAVEPASITNGEELLMFRGGQKGSLKP